MQTISILFKPNERSSHSSIVLRCGVIFSLAMVAWAVLMVVQGECGVVLRGKVVEEFYDELERTCCATYEVSAGTWHTLRALESGTVILEMKDGAYEPISDCDILIVQ